MKKVMNTGSFLYLIAILLAVGFIIRLGADYYQIQLGIRSQPFSVFLLERAFEFLLPGVLCLIAGIILKRRKHTS